MLDVGDVDILSEQLLTVLGRTDDGGVEVQEVDLLERETLGLGNAEVREHEAARAGGAPDEEHLDLEARVSGAGIDEVGRGVRNSPVPEPARQD